jgi:curved DNA-binding protein CbpA
MQSGSLSQQPVYELFCSFAVQRASGRLELTDGRRKRVFFFEGGKLSAADSNIKTESLTQLKASFPKASETQIAELQGNLRVINAISLREGEWHFTPNEAPKNRHSIGLLAACWQGIQRKMDLEEIENRLAGLDGRHPALDWANTITLKDLPLDPEVKSFLGELDGQRSLEDVLDFAPGEPGLATRSLYLCVISGAVKLGANMSGAEVRVTRREASGGATTLISEALAQKSQATKKPEPNPQSEDNMLGIASLIADEIGTDVAAPKLEGTDMTLSGDPEVRALQTVLAKMEQAENYFEVLGVNWKNSIQDNREAYFQLARKFHPDSNTALPEEQAELAHSIFTYISEAWETIGDEALVQAYIDKVIHGKLDENELAMEKVRLILQAEDEFRSAVAHLTAGRIVQAHELLKGCVESVPDEPEFQAYLGYTTFKLNKGRDQDEANRGQEALRIAVEQVAKAPGAWVLMGKVYNETGHGDLARSCFVKALKIQPTNPEANLEMKRLKGSRTTEKSSAGFIRGLFSKKK